MKKVIGEPLTLSNGSILPLSPGVFANGFIFVSGQLGLGSDGKLVEGDICSQTQQALINMMTVLNQRGANLRDIVKITGWIAQEEDFPAFNKVYGTFFTDGPPARSIVVSKLLIPGALIELEAIAIA